MAMVGVAQLVEPRVVIPVVVGSNPIVHPTPTAPLTVPDIGLLDFRDRKSNNPMSGTEKGTEKKKGR